MEFVYSHDEDKGDERQLLSVNRCFLYAANTEGAGNANAVKKVGSLSNLPAISHILHATMKSCVQRIVI